MHSEILERFSEKVKNEYLATYCGDLNRNYSSAGFKFDVSKISESDARGCMAAIDDGVVVDTGGGRYKAARSTINEVLFWEGDKTISPRPITLWLETVIIFAGLARLHSKYGWPISSLASQPSDWAFDIAAYKTEVNDAPDILCEVKKSVAEVARLRRDLEIMSRGDVDELATVKKNSAKKWASLLVQKPRVLWLLGPGEVEFIYLPKYTDEGAILRPFSDAVLGFKDESGALTN